LKHYSLILFQIPPIKPSKTLFFGPELAIFETVSMRSVSLLDRQWASKSLLPWQSASRAQDLSSAP
jgi:hypothetical protein